MMTLLNLLASDEPIHSEDVAAIWAWIMGSLAFVTTVVTVLVYRFCRHDQKLEARRLDADERAQERKFIHKTLGED